MVAVDHVDRETGCDLGSPTVSAGNDELPGHQDEVARLATEIAARLAADPRSEITAHLARVAARQAEPADDALEAAAEAIRDAPGVPGIPAGSKKERALTDAITQLATEVVAHRQALEAVLTVLSASFRPATHRHPDLEGELDALHDRFVTADRSRAWTPSELDLLGRIEALEQARRDGAGDG